MQSEELTALYKEYLKWLEQGAPDKEPFFRDAGLCHNLIIRAFIVDGNEAAMRVSVELRSQLYAAFASPTYPFNADSRDYLNEANSKKCHLNPKRIKWVRDHCNPQD